MTSSVTSSTETLAPERRLTTTHRAAAADAVVDQVDLTTVPVLRDRQHRTVTLGEASRSA
jgi:hypothetical protein